MPSLQLLNEWEWNLSHHTPTPDGVAKILQFREKVKELAELIIELAPDCRERDEALRQLELCLMYSNQAIARNETEEKTV
jgi:hypothetical protein